MRSLSLTTRLAAYFVLSSVAVLLGLGLLLASAMEEHFAEEDFAALSQDIAIVRHTVQSNPGAGMTSQLGEFVSMRPHLDVEVTRDDGTVVYRSPSLPAHLPMLADGRTNWSADGIVYRALREPAASGGLTITLVMNTFIHSHFLHAYQRTLAIYIALAALVTGLFGWWSARRGTRPLRTIAARAREVTASNLDGRMPVDGIPGEMADLAHTLNGMLDRLQRDFDRLSAFSTDLAHELRTPITNLMTNTEVVLGKPRSEDAYREALVSNVEELQRMSRMVSDMLYLAKVENELTLPSREPVRLTDEITALFDFYDAVAEDSGVRLSMHGDAVIDGDRLMIRRAVGNVLSNAIRHTDRGGDIVVTLETTGTTAAIHVDNDGPAIPEAILPHVFDRFTRLDHGGRRPGPDNAGLGLAITRAIAVAHGGSMAVTRVGERTRFTLRIPLS